MYLILRIFSADGLIKVFMPEVAVTEKEEENQSCVTSGVHIEPDTEEPIFDSNTTITPNTPNTSSSSTSTSKANERQKENEIPFLDDGNSK